MKLIKNWQIINLSNIRIDNKIKIDKIVIEINLVGTIKNIQNKDMISMINNININKKITMILS